ncbi:PAS domain-containing sensor histidine kinase [Bacillus licheniformis]|uniref:PAS domain-containing sensor histidine kinase n=2 Tax=Bacillus TaxID=1386 RepID=UPI0011A131D1|nr:PAS domain-containing sensor histidine kinase [Bacillus licheniformis]MBW7632016.1 PAS domain-containing sensor histidine kinase [Bacillus licheniformis]MED4304234.1 PAS domain-containing sensor histidine kinase [Bacillus licheniformis]TWK07061.1 Oxygen sensor histidine kinase NreB [Bacillus licheniformis]TWM90720.1 Oxygen sensor histidine kinase NreB [Bacillus licheniformis]TWN45347.1 Oxygen sensor histidine kinase NreB [Bacillus licheniformis]
MMCQNPARYTEEGMSNESGYLRQIFDHLQDGIIMMDQERTILVMNPSAEKMTGWKLGDKVPYCSYCQTRKLEAGEERCYLLAKREIPYFLSSMPTYEGRFVDMEMSTAVISENGDQMEVLLVLKDLTMKKKEEEAKISKLVLQKTLEAQENEHKRLAQELHDGVGQSLYSVSVGIQAIQSRMEQEETFKDYMQDIIDELEKAIQDVKLYSLQLRPHSLDQLGLIPAVKHLVSSLNKTHQDVSITFASSDISNRLLPIFEINLYRIIQEALHNALKYSQATLIEVILYKEDGELVLIIQDDGIGFERGLTEEGLGFKHMKERVDQMDGSLRIHSALQSGTTIKVKVQDKEGKESDQGIAGR